MIVFILKYNPIILGVEKERSIKVIAEIGAEYVKGKVSLNKGINELLLNTIGVNEVLHNRSIM